MGEPSCDACWGNVVKLSVTMVWEMVFLEVLGENLLPIFEIGDGACEIYAPSQRGHWGNSSNGSAAGVQGLQGG